MTVSDIIKKKVVLFILDMEDSHITTFSISACMYAYLRAYVFAHKLFMVRPVLSFYSCFRLFYEFSSLFHHLVVNHVLPQFLTSE